MADRSGAAQGASNCDSVAHVLGDCILDSDSLMLPGIHDTSMADLQVHPSEDELMLEDMVSAQQEMLQCTGLPRKSDRERRERRSFSPEHQRLQASGSTRGRRRKGTPRKLKKEETGQQITCELCFSPYVTNPLNQHPTAKKSRYRPSWRTRIDRNTGKLMVLCNACGLAYDRPQKVSRARPQPAPEDKQRYLDEVRDFAASLVKELEDPDAERLACPHFKMEGCGCIQRYIMGDESVEESRKRALELLGLLKQAKELSQKKFYDPEKVVETEGKGMKRPRNIGLGNGQKRSKEFEEFILHTRKMLRDELLLCERAAQRILMYSNNFLHKKLKTEARSCRVERTKGKYVMGLLKPIAALTREKCCTFRCVRMAVTLSSLLEEWRKRAASGQREARRVIAEMLTPSGGARPNCYNFIEMITGCSFSTIGKVNEQMRNSGGSREPPAHGMCHYWKKHPQKKRPRAGEQGDDGGHDGREEEDKQSGLDEDDGIPMDGTPSAEETAEAALSLDPFPVEVVPVTEVLVTNSEATEEPAEAPPTVIAPKQLTSVELVNHRQQIVALQKQLAQQQVQLQQQQQLLQQQMLHQVLLDQVNGTSGVHIQTLQSLQQLLNLQQQYQQQQLQQLNQLEEQAGLIPGTSDAATSHTGAILGGAELLQLPPSLLAQLSEQQQQQQGVGGLDTVTSQQQPVVLIQPLDSQQQLLQQQLQQHSLVLQTSTDSLITTAAQNADPTSSTAPSQDQEGGSEAALGTGEVMDVENEKGNSVESLVQIPVPTSSSIILPTPTSVAGSKGAGGTALLQQVIDLGQLGFGLQSLNPTTHNNPITLLNADASQLLSSLNITLVQSPPGVSSGPNNTTLAPCSTDPPSATQTLSSAMSASDIGDPPGSVMGATDESLTQLLASSLGYTVLTIEPGMMVDGTGSNTADKVSADNPAFIDMDAPIDSEAIAAADGGQVAKGGMLDVGLKVPGETETDGGEEPPSDMSTSEVLQLLAQHGIGITVAKSDQ